MRFGAAGSEGVDVLSADGDCFLRRRVAVGGGVFGLEGGRGISEVRLSRKSYCFWVEMICLLRLGSTSTLTGTGTRDMGIRELGWVVSPRDGGQNQGNLAVDK